jgi:osmotically-inducible protein OsmY
MNKTTLLLFLGTPLLLTSCIPAAFVGGAAATGVVAGDTRSVDTIASDHDINYKIEAQFVRDPVLKAKYNNISSTTFNHVVLLTGQVRDEDAKNQAEEIARKTPSVKKVYNQIEVSHRESALSESNDSWITTKVKTAMVGEKGLKSSQLKVITENGTVYLMGITTKEQGDLAAQATSKVQGVNKVVKLFEYSE